MNLAICWPASAKQKGQFEKDHSSGSVRRKRLKTENWPLRSLSPPPPHVACCRSLTDKLTFFEVLMPISVRVYWRWFWSSPWGHSSGHAICHLDCIVDSLERVRWLLIIYRLCCFRLHKDHMHRARWWTYTLIISLYLCAGRRGTIRSPSGAPLLSTIMPLFSKYSLLQLSSTYLWKLKK